VNITIYKEYLRWRDAKKELEGRLAEVKERMTFFEDLILEDMAEEGVDKVSVDGTLIFPKRQMYASAPVITEELRAALAEEHATDLVAETINSQRLSGFVREYMAQKELHDIEQLPEWMRNNMNIHVRASIGTR
jgi:hypothetical protein